MLRGPRMIAAPARMSRVSTRGSVAINVPIQTYRVEGTSTLDDPTGFYVHDSRLVDRRSETPMSSRSSSISPIGFSTEPMGPATVAS